MDGIYKATIYDRDVMYRFEIKCEKGTPSISNIEKCLRVSKTRKIPRTLHLADKASIIPLEEWEK